MSKKIKIIKINNLTWVDVIKAGEEELSYLKEQFGFHALDLKDCLPPLQRAKLIAQDDYLFMILQFPYYNRKTREILPTEIDFFIGANFIITHHAGEIPILEETFKDIQEDKKLQEEYFVENPATLLYKLLNKLLFYCFPMLNHISLDIDEAEKQIFQGKNKMAVREILIIKRNIVNFRKTMQPHKNVIKKLIHAAPKFFSITRLNIYFNYLVENTKEIWDHLENYKDSIDAIQDTNESLINFRTNEIIKTLTIFSVIILPLTLLAGIFGMNAKNMPIVESGRGFWYIIGIMLLGSVIMLGIFKNKKWL